MGFSYFYFALVKKSFSYFYFAPILGIILDSLSYE